MGYECVECADYFHNPNIKADDLWQRSGTQQFAERALNSYFASFSSGGTTIPFEQWIPWAYGGNKVPATWQCGVVADTAGWFVMPACLSSVFDTNDVLAMTTR